jgi:hypothetical protein
MAAAQVSLRVRSPQYITHKNHFVLSGCILWLLKKDEIDEHLLKGVDIDKGRINHPVLVLSADPLDPNSTILVVSILISGAHRGFYKRSLCVRQGSSRTFG